MADHLDGAGGARTGAEDRRCRQSRRNQLTPAEMKPAHQSFLPQLVAQSMRWR